MQTEYVATTKWDFVTHLQDAHGKDYTVETNFKVLTATSYEQAMQQAVALFGNNLSELQVHVY